MYIRYNATKQISKPSSQPPIPVNRDNRAPNGGEKFRGGYKSKPKARFDMINASDENTSLKIINVHNEVSTPSQAPSQNLFVSLYTAYRHFLSSSPSGSVPHLASSGFIGSGHIVFMSG